MFNVLDLFSQNGELALLLERTKGFKTTAYYHPDEGYRKVLSVAWPQAQKYDTLEGLLASPPPFECLTATINDSGIPFAENSKYAEFKTLLEALKPTWVISEHRAELCFESGIDAVLSLFDGLNYHAAWYGTPSTIEQNVLLPTDPIWIVAEPKANTPKTPVLDLVKYRLQSMGPYRNFLPQMTTPQQRLAPPQRNPSSNMRFIPLPVPCLIGDAIMFRSQLV